MAVRRDAVRDGYSGTLKRQLVEEGLTALARSGLDGIHVHGELDSTNLEALRLLEAGIPGNHLVLADSQWAGRGRRGSNWQSPPGAGLYLSLLHRGLPPAAGLQGLSLATALCVHRVVGSFCGAVLHLKWPNDVLVGEGKLAGILLETRSVGDSLAVVIGIGINYALDGGHKADIDRPVVALGDICDELPGREPLAAWVCSALYEAIGQMVTAGFASFQADWNRHDRYLRAEVMVNRGSQRVRGTCLGADRDGALLLLTPNGRQRIVDAELVGGLRAAHRGQVS